MYKSFLRSFSSQKYQVFLYKMAETDMNSISETIIYYLQPDVVAHLGSTHLQSQHFETEARESQVQASPGQLSETSSQNTG